MPHQLMQCAIRRVAAVTSVLAVTAVTEAGFTVRTIAVSGQPAPGTGADFGSMFICPVIDGQGRAAFYGAIDNEQTLGIFLERDTLELLALEGSPAPETDGAVFSSLANPFNPPNLGYDLAGNVYFKATLAGDDVVDCNFNGFPENDLAFYTNRNGVLELLIRENDPAPDQPRGVTLDQILTSGGVSPAGAFGGYFAMKGGECPFFSGADDVTLIDFGDGLIEIVAAGVSGPVAGTSFAGPGQHPRFSPHDSMLFTVPSGIEGEGVNQTNDAVLAVFDHGEFRLKVREGDPAPGTNGLIFGPNFGTFKSSIRGDVYAWVAQLHDDALEPAGQGLYISDAEDNLRPIAFVGDQVPGFSDGVMFQFLGGTDGSSSPWPIGVDDDANVAFHATIEGSDVMFASNEVLLLADPQSELSFIAREDDPAPGLPDGVRFGSNGMFFVVTFGTLAMNRQGNLAFVAHVYGPEFPAGDANALYFYDSDAAALRKALATNDQIDLSGDGSELRTVSRIERFNYDHALRNFNGTVLNESNQFSVAVSFTDGSAAMLVVDFDVEAVPGDVSGDGVVNAFDLLAVLSAWGACSNCDEDINGDGVVNVMDLLIVLTNWE